MSKSTRIKLLLALDTLFFVVELGTGYAVHSLALVADAFHMFNDILSLVVALWAVGVAKTQSSARFTYGLKRAEILGALVNGVFLLALCVTIFLEAIQRFVEVPEVQNPKLILIIGFWGLMSNILGLFVFHEHGHSHGNGSGHSHGGDNTSNSEGHHSHSNGGDEESGEYHHFVLPEEIVNEENRLLGSGHGHHARSASDYGSLGVSHDDHQHSQPRNLSTQKSMNMEGVFLHVLGDALGNVGVIFAALFIWKTDYWWRFYADPVISLAITCIIFASALPLCIRASRVLLMATPNSIDPYDLTKDIGSLPGVVDIHDLHVWQLNEELTVATLHAAIDIAPNKWPDLAKEIQRCFAGYNIPSITIQPEFTTVKPVLSQCVSYGNLPTGFNTDPSSRPDDS